jgi:hypothetical protein
MIEKKKNLNWAQAIVKRRKMRRAARNKRRKKKREGRPVPMGVQLLLGGPSSEGDVMALREERSLHAQEYLAPSCRYANYLKYDTIC